uniref:Dicentracin-like n=1 Tax=Poecilia reticulata TaxID=8081 RepID=A0A3P9PTB1_POERE
MKFVTLFLVASLVVLMAEPGECFLKKLWYRIKAAAKGLDQDQQDQEDLDQQQLDKRSYQSARRLFD